MRNIIYSCLGKNSLTYAENLQLFMEEADSYAKKYKAVGILKDAERKYFKYLVNCFQSAGEMPSKALFEQVFPETSGAFDSSTEIGEQDFRVYIFNLLGRRVNTYVHDRIAQLNLRVKDEGITEEINEEFNKLQALSNINASKDVSIEINSRLEYNNKKLRPSGLKTGIKEVDDKIGGMDEGTITTIAGFTSQFKSTWALNIAHLNAYDFGYNIVYISLETPKQDMNWNLLSLHSYSEHLSKYNYIPHDKMRHCKLSSEEEDYLFDTVEKDMVSPVIVDGKTYERGKVIILDESDFNTFNFSEIISVLEKIDDKIPLDAVIVDYVQLCKFSGSGITSDANSYINSYVAFFRRLSQNFRKTVDSAGNPIIKKLAVILLAQLNRGGWMKASRNEGKYDLTALADANEIERGSARIFTTYTTEELKARNSAQVQILKNRAGETMYDPALVFVEPAAYLFCNETAGQGMAFSGQVNFAGQDELLSAFEADQELDELINGLGV